MPILRITRFSTDPARSEEVLAKRAVLVDAARAANPGLTDTRLAKIDEGTWVDVWQWESDEALRQGIAWAHGQPAAAAAFALVKEATEEKGELVG